VTKLERVRIAPTIEKMVETILRLFRRVERRHMSSVVRRVG